MSFKADPPSPPPAVTVTKIAYPGPVIGNPLRRKNTLWLQPSLRGQLCNFSVQPRAISIFHVLQKDRDLECCLKCLWPNLYFYCSTDGDCFVCELNQRMRAESRVCVVCSTNLCEFYLDFFIYFFFKKRDEKYFSVSPKCDLDSRNNLWLLCF